VRKIRKGDEVLVIRGEDRGRKGKVMRSFPREDRIVVEGVNLVKRHLRPGRARQAGIVTMEAPIHVSKVKLLCKKCNQPTRVGFRLLSDGSKVRWCKKCGEVID